MNSTVDGEDGAETVAETLSSRVRLTLPDATIIVVTRENGTVTYEPDRSAMFPHLSKDEQYNVWELMERAGNEFRHYCFADTTPQLRDSGLPYVLPPGYRAAVKAYKEYKSLAEEIAKQQEASKSRVDRIAARISASVQKWERHEEYGREYENEFDSGPFTVRLGGSFITFLTGGTNETDLPELVKLVTAIADAYEATREDDEKEEQS